MLLTAVAYRIINTSNKEVVLAGIVRNSEDTIYPAQEDPCLLEEFPTLPYECELHHFNVPGLKVESFYFSTTWTELGKWIDEGV